MNGGTISDNDAAYGGGVCLFSAEDDKQKQYNVFKTNDTETSGGNASGTVSVETKQKLLRKTNSLYRQRDINSAIGGKP